MFLELLDNFPAQSLNSGYSIGCVERGIEEAGIFQHPQKDVKQFGANRQLQDFGAVGFTGPALFFNFRLIDAAAVKSLLDNDALEAANSGLGGHGGSVVAAGGGHHAFIAMLGGMVYRQGCPAGLKAA